MIIEIAGGAEGLKRLLMRQLDFFLPDQNERDCVDAVFEAVMKEVECGFNGICQKYYQLESGETRFNPHHSAQFGIFLYRLSKALARQEMIKAADMVYALGKMRNSCDLFHQIDLPECFYMEHPIGSVLGRAEYGNNLVFQQNCTVGGNRGVYPVLGDFVWLHANSSVIGNCRIGNNVFLAANTHVMNAEIPDNSLVFGSSPNLIIKERPDSYFYEKSPFWTHQ